MMKSNLLIAVFLCFFALNVKSQQLDSLVQSSVLKFTNVFSFPGATVTRSRDTITVSYDSLQLRYNQLLLRVEELENWRKKFTISWTQ